MARGNGNGGSNGLGAFMNQVNAQRGKKISNADAAMLSAFAENCLAQTP